MKTLALTTPYDISPRLRSAWQASGLRRSEIAHRAGMSWAQLYKILEGQRPQVSADTVRRLALALGVSTDYLLGLTPEPSP